MRSLAESAGLLYKTYRPDYRYLSLLSISHLNTVLCLVLLVVVL